MGRALQGSGRVCVLSVRGEMLEKAASFCCKVIPDCRLSLEALGGHKCVRLTALVFALAASLSLS